MKKLGNIMKIKMISATFKKKILLEQVKLDAEVSIIALRLFEKTKKQFFKDFADKTIERIKKLKKQIQYEQ